MVGPVVMLEPLPPALRETVQGLAGEDIALRFIDTGDASAMRAALVGAPYAIVRGLPLPEPVLRHAQGLKLVHQWGTGTDGIPVRAAAEMGIQVAKCPGINAPSVADLTLALMLAALRRLPQTDAAVRAGRWASPALWDHARDLAGARVGLVGYGAIGQAVAARLVGFGCDILYWRRSGPVEGAPGRYADLDELFGTADVVSLHVPLTEETRGFVDAARLATMKPGAVLVNTARGGLVDEPALIAALQSGQLGGAGLDVFAEEPAAPSNPLLRLENTVVTPHVGGGTRDNLHRMVRYWAANIRRHANGEPLAKGDLVN